MFPLPNVPQTRMVECVSVSMSVIPATSLVYKVGFIYLPGGEVEPLRHTVPHCSVQLSVAFEPM